MAAAPDAFPAAPPPPDPVTEGGLCGDMPAACWIDRHLPPLWRPYARLMRLDRPIGTWLLLLPAWWSLLAAGADWRRTLGQIVLFSVGSVVMRGAGCTINDIIDRDFDARVARTASRPIPSGAVTVRQAWIFLGGQLLVGLGVLLCLNGAAVALGAASLLLVGLYPFMKRLTYWPQAWLGLTFNWGALLGWVAVADRLAAPAFAFYAAGVFWTLGYDTIYAHQDKTDDQQIGVKSTALRLGAATGRWLLLFYGLTLGLLALAGELAGLGRGGYGLGLLALAGHFLWQIRTVQIDDPGNCLRLFRSNRDAGLIIAATVLLGRLTG